MPTYQYVCTECGQPLEAVQSFSDAPLEECPHCQGRLRKVFSAVGVVFKGSGFYKTDSRGTKPGSTEPATSDKPTGDKPTEKKAADKTAADQPAAPAATSGAKSEKAEQSKSSGGSAKGDSKVA